MKQETKELIKWVKIQLLAQTKGNDDEFNQEINKACNFLDSLPEIESHLCRGGYIQDRNGTPCCDGDKVKIKDKEYTLYWSKSDKCFYMRPAISPEVLEIVSINIEKVE